jgi:hypothetical protein
LAGVRLGREREEGVGIGGVGFVFDDGRELRGAGEGADVAFASPQASRGGAGTE